MSHGNDAVRLRYSVEHIEGSVYIYHSMEAWLIGWVWFGD